MKPYKFLIPVGLAASALAGLAPKANATRQPEVRIEQTADSSAAAAQSSVQKYVANGEENTLLLRVGDQGVPFAHHDSHASHASHASHSSHSSHTSGM